MTARKKSVASSAIELVVIIATALGLALAIQAFVVKPYRIPSGSMLPTLHINQRVLVNRIGSHFSSPSVGNIIVFHPPKGYDQGCADSSEGESQSGQDAAKPCGVAQSTPSSETFIKRLVGLPGDRISIRGGHVIRNSVPEKDSYIAPCNGTGSCDFPVTITIPRGDYFMMGDNRGLSDDSRFWGPVPKSWIIGRAFFTYWPPGQLGLL
ncbi:MAG: signal peptidase I [Solirubrobacteraceae bacterium]